MSRGPGSMFIAVIIPLILVGGVVHFAVFVAAPLRRMADALEAYVALHPDLVHTKKSNGGE